MYFYTLAGGADLGRSRLVLHNLRCLENFISFAKFYDNDIVSVNAVFAPFLVCFVECEYQKD